MQIELSEIRLRSQTKKNDFMADLMEKRLLIVSLRFTSKTGFLC